MTPSPVPDRELLAAQDAAKYLNISTTRLRAMVDEGKLAAVSVGERYSAYPRAELDRFLAQRAGEAVTPVAALLEEPGAPLRRVHDLVVPVPEHFDGSRMHVRVWEGPDQGGRLRTVVLVAGLHGTVYPGHSYWEIAADVVNQRLLSGRGIDAVWFSITASGEAEVVNVVQRQETSKPRRRGWFGPRVVDQAVEGLSAPEFRLSSWTEMERIIGEPVEFYPGISYTEDTIHRWQRAKNTVDVVNDKDYRLGRLADALTVMHAVRADDPHSATARAAAAELAFAIKDRISYLADAPWDDGTVFPGMGRKDRFLPTVFGARLVKPTLTSRQLELVSRYNQDPEPLPWTPAQIRAHEDLLDGLWRWHEEVDEFADVPDGPTDDAVTEAIWVVDYRLQSAYSRAADVWLGRVEAGGTPYPGASPRSVSLTEGPLDQRYLAALTRESADAPRTRDHRRLLDEVFRSADVWFARDTSGNLVAVEEHEPREGFDADAVARLLALWPHTPPKRGLPTGSAIVADGGPGPRPAYIEYPDGRLELLPVKLENVHDQWNFGYAGGGPGMLTGAIIHTIATCDNISRERIPYRWITDAVDYSDRDSLRISVDDIRRRIGPPDAGRWPTYYPPTLGS